MSNDNSKAVDYILSKDGTLTITGKGVTVSLKKGDANLSIGTEDGFYCEWTNSRGCWWIDLPSDNSRYNSSPWTYGYKLVGQMKERIEIIYSLEQFVGKEWVGVTLPTLPMHGFTKTLI